MINVRHLSYTYPDGAAALRGITLCVPDGTKVALVGPNGAGKSTLLQMLLGARFGEGDVSIAGVRLTRKTVPTVRRRLGIVFQNPEDQLFSTTVAEDIAFGPRNFGLSAEEVQARVNDQLARFHLTDVAERPPFHLSLGQKRRASIACALALDPEVLLCDEPSSNLDPRMRRELIGFLCGFDRTLLVATHDLDLALDVTDRCVVLDAGLVVADAPTKEILGNEDLLRAHSLELPLSYQPRPERNSP